MPNIKFNYLYRDSANYKKFISVIFANPAAIELSELELLIREHLIWGTWFYADDWNLPQIFTDIWDHKIDPTRHEFENIEPTDEAANDLFNIDRFVTAII